MSVGSAVGRLVFALGRTLFGGLLAYMGVKNLQEMSGRIAYAEAKEVPNANILVPASSGALVAGGVGIALWKFPRLAAAGVAAFLAGVTPTIHDFWNMEDEERMNERNAFLKNAALFGAALAILGSGKRAHPSASTLADPTEETRTDDAAEPAETVDTVE
ncbi:DoxX family membrane protein [Haloprofundus sp. MHR1]|uniref:DoxX family membrane protein n=1 Tax=Haloprofundus sp. MHR1 TaxID=2572921 RepID=UPI0010BF42DA|nr:DoxX family membrane protein [Haloprofundus sp. MHR1]QCJ47338.1 DoxX family membrane protein [Haloprofundus sp. MHR1]